MIHWYRSDWDTAPGGWVVEFWDARQKKGWVHWGPTWVAALWNVCLFRWAGRFYERCKVV